MSFSRFVAITFALVASGVTIVRGQPFFQVGWEKGRAALIKPDGSKFWSMGVCCTGAGSDWKDVDASNPSYSAFRLFPSAKAWVDDTESKLSDWGFNTLGGWSDMDLFRRFKSKMPYTVVLHLGAWNKAPWKDVFTSETAFWANHAAKEQIDPLKDDPNLVGYFTDNELGWWDDTIFVHYLKNLLPTEPGRVRAHAELKKFYRGSFSDFQKDWNTPRKTWKEFAANPTFTLKPGGNGMAAVNNWMAVVGDYYGSLMQKSIRKYDTKHMILGERYVQFYNQAYARAAAKYCDVVSTNSGANWNDGTYCHYFLDTLHNLTGKPLMVTEFYMAATENRSGNKNTGTAFPEVQTQEERGVAFRNCLDTFASRPYLVGAHWFQFHDEPANGRGDGEDYNMGLVDIFGVPYTELTERSKTFDALSVRSQDAPNVSEANVPKWSYATSSPASLKLWPREQGYVAGRSKTAFGDLYANVDDNALSFGLFAVDYMDLSLYEGGKIPESERPTLNLKLGEKEWTIRFGGWSGDKDKKKDLPATCTVPGVILEEKPDLSHTLIVRIPLTQIPAISQSNRKVRLRATLTSHSRAETMSWDTTLTLQP